MKCLFTVLIFVLISSKEPMPAKSEVKVLPSIEGTWELVSRFNWEKGTIKDTILNTNGYRQLKIYGKKTVMWTRNSPEDPEEWFGYGTYESEQNILSEKYEFASKALLKHVETERVYKFELQLDEETYSQTKINAEGNRIISENYKRIDE